MANLGYFKFLFKRVSVPFFALGFFLPAFGVPSPAKNRYAVVYHLEVTSTKRGKLQDINYWALLDPSSTTSPKIAGKGHYYGHVTSMRLNCQQGPDDPQTYEVLGNINATGFERTAGLDHPEITLSLITQDWRIKPMAFLGDEIATTPEELEAVKGGGSVFVLPPMAMPDEQDQEIRTRIENGGECDGDIVWKSTIDVKRQKLPEDLKANLEATTGRMRGERLEFDGSQSTPLGKISSYHWRLTPGANCPEGTQPFEREGAKLSFRSLCSFNAELTVKAEGSDKTDKTEKAVDVSPRPWRTSYKTKEDPKKLKSRLIHGNAGLRYGKNVCTEEGLTGDQESGHQIHRTEDLSWEHSGFEVEQISDPDGPFDGWWYIKKHSFKVDRSSLISQDLFSDSDVFKHNKTECESHGIDWKVCDFNILIQTVTKHEAFHAELVRKALRDGTLNLDAAKAIEGFQLPPSATHDDLVKKANNECRRVESGLQSATTDDHVVAMLKDKFPISDGPGTIVLPDNNGVYQSHPIPNLAEMGAE